jgi:hypothetical protein
VRKALLTKDFGFKDMDKLKDGQFLKLAMVAKGVAAGFVTELTAKGYDAADNTALGTLITTYVDGLQNQNLEIGSRDSAQENRVLKGNEIYGLLEKELCEAAKSYWRTRSAAKENDYIIYNNESGHGAPEGTTNTPVLNGQIVVLVNGVAPADPGHFYFKNRGPAGCILHIYFGSLVSNLYAGTGITLTSGQHLIAEPSDIGPIHQFLLCQNLSGVDGSIDFAPLS